MVSGSQLCSHRIEIDKPDSPTPTVYKCELPRLPRQDKCLFHAPAEAKNAAEFYNAIKERMAGGDYYFMGFIFPGDADFHQAQFSGYANFSGARFSGEANFISAKFCNYANFAGARFSGATYFESTRFLNTVEFTSAQWLQRALFEKVEFGPGSSFSETDVGQVIFRSSNLSNCSFRSAYGIESAEFDDITWNRLRGNNIVTGDETKPSFLKRLKRISSSTRDGVTADELAARKSGDPGDFKAAERVYRHLRRSYDARRDYPRSRDFYFGEMEMRRLAGGRWHERLLVNLFHLTSGYGQRWVRAVWPLGIVLLVSAVLYALSGLVTTQDETLLQVVPGWSGWSGLGDAAKILGESLLYSINAAVLRPSDFARPFSGWGRTLQALELVLGPAFITILVLAIREQFRR